MYSINEFNFWFRSTNSNLNSKGITSHYNYCIALVQGDKYLLLKHENKKLINYFDEHDVYDDHDIHQNQNTTTVDFLSLIDALEKIINE